MDEANAAVEIARISSSSCGYALLGIFMHSFLLFLFSLLDAHTYVYKEEGSILCLDDLISFLKHGLFYFSKGFFFFRSLDFFILFFSFFSYIIRFS